MEYAPIKSLVQVERAEDDGFLETQMGIQPVTKGNLICTDMFGNKSVVDENYFYDNYIMIRKLRKVRTPRQSPFEIQNAYEEMGRLVKQSNENEENYIF